VRQKPDARFIKEKTGGNNKNKPNYRRIIVKTRKKKCGSDVIWLNLNWPTNTPPAWDKQNKKPMAQGEKIVSKKKNKMGEGCNEIEKKKNCQNGGEKGRGGEEKGGQRVEEGK